MLRAMSMCLVALLLQLALGCAADRTTPSDEPRLTAADIDTLAGTPWVGTLTYLDYQSSRLTTIDSSLIVRRTADAPPAWEFGVGYSKEPHADAKETVALADDGRSLGDEVVISRETLPDGAVRFITEVDGKDDHRPARFRFVHTVSARAYTRSKLVRFEGDREFFERHVYRWSR